MVANHQPPNIVGIWIGNSYGTHPGPLYAEFREEADTIAATIRATIGGKVTILEGHGTLSDRLDLSLMEKSMAGNEPATISIQSKTVTDNFIEATWKSTSGAAGVLSLSRYQFAQSAPVPVSAPTQIETRELPLKTVRLTRADVEGLLREFFKVLPKHNDIVVTVTQGTNKTTVFAQEFFTKTDLPLAPSEITISAGQMEGGFQKTISVTLGRATNLVRAQWYDIQWVTGSSEVLATFINERANRFLNLWRKAWANLNFILFLVLLILLPDLTLGQRFAYTVVFFAIMWLHRYLILRITETAIYLGQEARSWAAGIWPAVLAILTSAIGGALAIYLYDLLKEFVWPVKWLS